MEDKKINHWCVTCGVGYHGCDSCNDVKSFTPWRTLADTLDHYKIYLIVCDYRDKKISKEKAKEMLGNVDITGWENFKDGVKNFISEILQEDVAEEVKENVIEEPVVKTTKRSK